MTVMIKKCSFSGLVLGFSEPFYLEREGASVITHLVIKSGQLAPSLTVEVSFGNGNGTAEGSYEYTTNV